MNTIATSLNSQQRWSFVLLHVLRCHSLWSVHTKCYLHTHTYIQNGPKVLEQIKDVTETSQYMTKRVSTGIHLMCSVVCAFNNTKCVCHLRLCISYRQYTQQSSNMCVYIYIRTYIYLYITLIPLPVSSVYAHPQEGYIQFKTYYIKLHKTA
jgi:hypothetical protein